MRDKVALQEDAKKMSSQAGVDALYPECKFHYKDDHHIDHQSGHSLHWNFQLGRFLRRSHLVTEK